MRVEIPECKRCCCCIPLRNGIIVFGYLNLISSIFILLTEMFIEFQASPDVAVHRGVIYFSNFWYASILFVSDVVFNIVLLFGAHMKKTRLLRAYYYYAVTTTLLCLVSFIILRTEQLYDQVSFYVVEACFVLSSLGIQVYLILLVRSELAKIRQRSRVCYVNHAAEIIVETPEQVGNTDVETVTLRDASK
ncbi:uncharacterized protein LOC123661014 [Melitaea cinxia]|uniref:uncharacterized protein LOC123661014 n=1 Tax=Melitaea cinxia TaxID=113334 RepID=UPI001E271006|nr:uncharacterized protein LOC123661014 [Melitaea cinxia]